MSEAQRLPEGFSRMTIAEASDSEPEGAARYGDSERQSIYEMILAGKMPYRGPEDVKAWLLTVSGAEARAQLKAWQQTAPAEVGLPSLAHLAKQAGYATAPSVGSVFRTRGRGVD